MNAHIIQASLVAALLVALQGNAVAAQPKKDALPGTSAAIALPLSHAGAEAELIDAGTPWRGYVVVGPRLERQGGALRLAQARGGRTEPFDPASADAEVCGFSRLPPPDWTAAAGDVSSWARYLQSDLFDFLGDYGVQRAAGRGSAPALLCLRTAFGIAEPARATDLKVTVACIGGAVVYVNGREVGRGYLPAGPLHPLTPAEDYPAEAYTAEDGSPLPELTLRTQPEEGLLPRYQQRIRKFTVGVPREALVKGGNVLCVELHQSPAAPAFPRAAWLHLGIREIRVTSASGSGVIAYAEANRGTRVWSANPEDQIADPPTAQSLLRREEGRPVIWMRGKAVRGIQFGNPFDPVLPIRMAAPRNGVASGQVVVSDPEGIRSVAASLSALKGPRGAEIPAGAVEIRYAAQQPPIHFCDALLPAPPQEARTVPVWTIVEVPGNQVPGWYVGALAVKANGRGFSVPVQLLVAGPTVPDARNFTTLIGANVAADTIAAHYGVVPWSDEHFRLMAPSMRMAGQVGNDVLYVPVVLGGMSVSFRNKMTRGSAGPRFQPLVRFVREGQRLLPDFTLLEKYLDAYVKHCAPPRALSFYVWEAGCSKEIGFAYENARIAGSRTEELPGRPGQVTTPLLVLEWDPKTGATKEVEAPAITDNGADAFYKPLFDGARALVVRRGWSERIVLAGLGGDLRPGEESGELFRRWLPYVRWNLLSHFSGDPSPRDGKMIASGKLEVGLKEYPWRSAFLRPYTAAELERELTETVDFLDLPTARWHWQDDSGLMTFRTLPMLWGAVGHIGLDFWPQVRGVPGNTSFFTASRALTVPGAGGAEPTVRFQMFREGVQDMELRTMIVRAYLRLPEEQRGRYRELLDEFPRRVAWSAGALSQYELGYDWRGYAAQVQAAAAELAGVKSEAAWQRPPQ